MKRSRAGAAVSFEEQDLEDQVVEFQEGELYCDVESDNDYPEAGEFASSEVEARSSKRLAFSTTSSSGAVPQPIVADVPAQIKYAPTRHAVSGDVKLAVLVLGWKDHKNPSTGSAASMGNAIERTYKELSGGRLRFNATAKTVKLNLNFARKNYNKAVAQAKSQNKGYHMYAIVHGGVRKFSNSGGNTCNLIGTLNTTGLHEVGHILDCIPGAKGQSLGHATATTGKGGDGTSFMSYVSSSRITAPQMYNLGWLSDVAQFEVGTSYTDYPMEPLFVDEHQEGSVRAIRIPRENGREIFVSYNQIQGELRFLAHYRTGGGSQLFNRFNDQAVQLDVNLYAKKISEPSTNRPVLRLSSSPL